jgi:hypothetical protein
MLTVQLINTTGLGASRADIQVPLQNSFLKANQPMALAKWHSFVLLFNLFVITKHYFTSGGTFMR